MKKTLLLTALMAGTVHAATVAFNFAHGDFSAATSIGAGENTAALDAVASLDTPAWITTNITGTGGTTNGQTFSASGVSGTLYASGSWQAGSEGVTAGNDASQQVFRIYADDSDGGGSYFNGDSIGVSVHLTGLSAYLTANSATAYKVSLFYNTDSTSASFGDATFYSGTADLPSATAITGLTSLGTASATVLGNGTQPVPTGAQTNTGGTRGYAVSSDMTADDLVIALADRDGTSSTRHTLAGFAITTVVPEPSTGLLGLFGGMAALLRRRRV